MPVIDIVIIISYNYINRRNVSQNLNIIAYSALLCGRVDAVKHNVSNYIVIGILELNSLTSVKGKITLKIIEWF